jgi:type I restriction enzyme S subunit
MKRWPTKPLGEVAQVTTGNPAPQREQDFSDDGVPFVRMQDVGRYGQTTCLAEIKDRLSVSASNKFKRFPAGSILVPKSGASIRLNHRAILGVEAHVVSHLAVIVPRPLLDTRFAYYWLCGTDLSGVAHQADMPSMKTSELAKLQIPVPPLAEQKRIAKLLDEADELRKLRAQADRRTADLIPALFHQMFGDPTHIEKMRWPFRPVGEFARVSYGLADKLDSSTKPEIGTRILTISNILLNGSIETQVEKYSVVEPAGRAKARLQKFDLLFNWRNGSEAHVGKTAIWEEQLEGEVLHVSFLLKIRVDQSQADPYFLWALINRLRATGYFTRNARMQINRKFNASELSALKLPLPPLPLQKEFAARVSEIRAVQAEQATSRRRLDDLFQSTLHRAFQGEL